MAETVKLTEAQARAMESVVNGTASRFRSTRSSRDDTWQGIRADVAKRLIDMRLAELGPTAGYTFGVQRLQPTDAGRAALAKHREVING